MEAPGEPAAQRSGHEPPEPTQPQAVPRQAPTRTEELAARMVARFPGAKVDYVREKRLKVTVSPEEMREAALFARDELGFDHVSAVAGTDYISKGEIEIVYFVGSLSRAGYEDLILALAERPRRDNPVVPSLAEVWIGGEYQERETYEMLGVNFQGHPDLRHLLLPEDWSDLPPLRKDYHSPGR